MNIQKLLIHMSVVITLTSISQFSFANDNTSSKYDETITHFFCYPYSCRSEKSDYSKDKYVYLGEPLKYSLELLETYTTTTDSHCKVLN